jgi:outer membrane protein insertion porin family
MMEARRIKTASAMGWTIAALFAFLMPVATHAQAPLFYASDGTLVRKISFKYVDHRTLEADELKKKIVTTSPTTVDRIKRYIPFVSPTRHQFDPVVLQKDVVRLRRHYREHGFLFAEVDYPASQLDTTHNTIHVIFSIVEGPPLILQDFGFYDSAGNYTLDALPTALQRDWVRFRDQLSLQVGQRYTDAERIRIQDQVLNWMKEHGFAFARVTASAQVDSVFSTADVQYVIEPGPLTHFADVVIEGNTSVDDRILIRELPFRSGDIYSNKKVSQGQQDIFGLRLFRVALSDIPDQPVDSTVTVRYRVREAKLRFLTGQSGYSREDGLAMQGEWRHRNFLGAARNFAVSTIAQTGWLATTGDNVTPRLFNFSVSIGQPFLFSPRLSGSLSPYVQFERDPNLRESGRTLGINRRDVGFVTSVVYQKYTFRPISLGYTFVRSLQYTSQRDDVTIEQRDLFNKSVLSLSGTFGKLDNYLSPRKGYLVQPYVESAEALLGSAIEYIKLGTEAQAFVPITKRWSIGTRIQIGRLWPLATTLERLDSGDPLFEDRFDPILFYAGGAIDVRGWNTGLLGAKTARQAGQEDPRIVYEAAGGRTRLAINLELKYTLPGYGRKWQLASFADAGQVSSREVTLSDGSSTIVDDGRIRLNNMFYAVGTGVRYRTPVGLVRLDLAFKLNPSTKDLLSPEDAYAGIDNEKFSRRFNLHLSIGQTF